MEEGALQEVLTACPSWQRARIEMRQDWEGEEQNNTPSGKLGLSLDAYFVG